MSEHYTEARRWLGEENAGVIHALLYVGEQLEVLAGLFGETRANTATPTLLAPGPRRDIERAASVLGRLAETHEVWGEVPVKATHEGLMEILREHGG